MTCEKCGGRAVWSDGNDRFIGNVLVCRDCYLEGEHIHGDDDADADDLDYVRQGIEWDRD